MKILKTLSMATAGAAFIALEAVSADPAVAFSVTQSSDFAGLLNSLLGSTSGLSDFEVTASGNANGFGVFNNDPFGLGSGVILSTGNAVDVVGPNDSSSTSGPGALTQLDISFFADDTANNLSFQYVFGSEEFLEYAGSGFNDFFALELNGVNLAKLGNGLPVTINNLASSPSGPYAPELVINTENITQLDAYTTALTFSGSPNKNAQNLLSFKISDVGDSAFDSAVFIKGGSLGTQGSTQENPILPDLINDQTWVFTNVPTGQWVDPPMASGFEYTMTSNSLFTSILDFPNGIDSDNLFEVLVAGMSLGQFGPGQTVDFTSYSGGGVSGFTIAGINPAVDGGDPTAFPLKLAFNTPTASFTMQPIQASGAQPVPEPASMLGIMAFGALGGGRLLKRKKQAALVSK